MAGVAQMLAVTSARLREDLDNRIDSVNNFDTYLHFDFNGSLGDEGIV